MTHGPPSTNIAMWSGPRNISTAMMYAFAARGDCQVWDEPFYAHYLTRTGLAHPLREEVIAAGDPDFSAVASKCCDPPASGSAVFYQKHMAHHMLPGQDWSWCFKVSNAFLIRSPERVLASYAAKREEVALADIGFERQAQLFDMVADRTGNAPPVVDCEDILSAPETVLGALCSRLGITFVPTMLEWQSGPKPYDGVWARHWYHAVWKTTCFGSPKNGVPKLPGPLAAIADQARPFYEKLKSHRIPA